MISSTARAGQCSNSLFLKVGDTVTDCDRIGFSLEFEKTVRQQIIENDYNLKIIEEQKNIILLKELTISASQEQAKIWKEESDRMRKKYDDVHDARSKDFFYGFIGGILLTAVAAWSIGQVARTTGN